MFRQIHISESYVFECRELYLLISDHSLRHAHLTPIRIFPVFKILKHLDFGILNCIGIVIYRYTLYVRFSLLKIGTDDARCNDCNACATMCPMDIQIPDYVHAGERVLSTECTLCQTCVTVCTHDALKLSFGLDVGGRESLRLHENSQRIERELEEKQLSSSLL